jgi:hypothetical protein
VNGEIAIFYQRNVSTPPSGGDVSSVELRIPVKFEQSYQSWRQLFFGANAFNDVISGKNADPDGDGIVNIDEFEGGTNPNVIDLGPLFITFAPPPIAAAPGAGALMADGDDVPQIRYDKPGGIESQSTRTVEYSFETSTNGTDWDTIDETRWDVDEDDVSMSATYVGSDPLPPTMLFRVRYTTPAE